MPAVGQQGHGPEHISGNNLHPHGDEGKNENLYGSAFSPVVDGGKIMAVLPLPECMNMHVESLPCSRLNTINPYSLNVGPVNPYSFELYFSGVIKQGDKKTGS
jgi:hypothetical protein